MQASLHLMANSLDGRSETNLRSDVMAPEGDGSKVAGIRKLSEGLFCSIQLLYI